MQKLDLASAAFQPVTNFDSEGVRSAHLAQGEGESHVYLLDFEAGGSIGVHPTGFEQIFLVLEGAGWAAGPDGVRVSLAPGEAARYGIGEQHSKGSEFGMRALMIQMKNPKPLPANSDESEK